MNPVERIIYALGCSCQRRYDGLAYAQAIPLSRIFCVFAHNVSGLLPLNPTGLCTHLALRAAHDDFISDQHRPATLLGETTASYLSQIAAIPFDVHFSRNRFSGGIAFIRGLTGRPLGNFTLISPARSHEYCQSQSWWDSVDH